MTVIAFRPRPRAASRRTCGHPGALWLGRSGRHVAGWATWWARLRVHRLVVVPRGTFVTGVFTGELRDDDGSLVGVDTRRATIAADLVREGHGYLPVLRPFQLDLMGITVDVDATTIDPALAPEPEPRAAVAGGARPTAGSAWGSVMKLLALLTPCAMLAVLWALQRLEVWMERRLGSAWSRPHAPRWPAPDASAPGAE